MSQWENLPEPVPERPVVPVAASWSGFSADPRVPANQGLRASDADRDFAARLLEQARLDGRLDPAEQDARALEAVRARTLGELAPLVSDLMVAHAAAADTGGNRFARAGLTGWVGLALLFNAIWLMTCLTAGRLLYYWPMWPMLGTGIPVLMALMWGGQEGGGRDPSSAGRRTARDQRHALREGRRRSRRGAVGPALPPGPNQDLR